MGGVGEDRRFSGIYRTGVTAPTFWHVARTPGRDRDQAAITAAVRALGRYLDVAEAQPGWHGFLAVGVPTLADIQFAHVLHRCYDIDVFRPEHPGLRRCHDRLTARPARREHVMESYEGLRVS